MQSDETNEPEEIKLSNVLDASVIASLRAIRPGNNTGFLAIINIFLEEAPQRLATMRSALSEDDEKTLASVAHALKGSSGALGAKRMAALCEIIEKRCRAGSTQGVEVLLAVLEEEFTYVRRALDMEKKR